MGSVVRRREVPQRHTPVRRPNQELRTREHLTERVEKLIEAAKGNRWGHRDASQDAFEASERNLPKFVNARSTVKGCL